MKYKYHVLCFICLACAPLLKAQPMTLPELKNRLRQETGMPEKIAAASEIFEYYKNTAPDKDSILRYATLKLELANQSRDALQTGKAYCDLGIAYSRNQNSQKSGESFEQAVNIFRRIRNKDAEAKALGYLANLNLINGNLDLCIRIAHQAIGITNDHKTIAAAHVVLCLAYGRIHNEPDAVKFGTEGLRFATLASDTTSLTELYRALGFAYQASGNMQKAEFAFRKMLEFERFGKSIRLRLFSVLSLVDFFVAVDKIDSAQSYINLVVRHPLFQTDTRLKAFASSSLAKIYIEKNRNEEAAILATQAIKIFTENKELVNLNNTLRIRARAYAHAKNYEKAYENLEQAYEMHDTLMSSEKMREIQSIRENFLLEQQEKEYEIKLKEEAYNKERFLSGLLAASILAIMLIFLLIWKTYTNKQLVNKNEQIKSHLNEINQINQHKDQILGVLSHDLRGPLNSGSLLLSRILKTDMPEIKSLKLLQRNIANTLLITENLLYWAKMQMSGINSFKTQIELRTFSIHSIEQLKVEADLKNIRILNEIPNGYNCWTDEHLLQIVFRNLLSNAIKHTPEGGEIEIRADQNEESDFIYIHDSGPGVKDPANLAILLQEEGTRDNTGGQNTFSGIGLSISARMIRVCGGRISLAKTGTDGSTFVISIPADEDRVAQSA